MANEVYLTQSANEILQSLDLSDDQAKSLHQAMDQLREGNPSENRVVYADGSPSGGLRELTNNGIRLFFRYDPTSHAVMVADIRTKLSANGSERTNELAAIA